MGAVAFSEAHGVSEAVRGGMACAALRRRRRSPSVRARSASEERERGDKASRRAAEREAHRARERAERAAREQRRLGIEDMQARARPPAASP